LVAALLYFLREYLLYIGKAGHIAVLVELIEGRAIPAGRSQTDHASAVVRARFTETNTLLALDLLIKGVLRVIMGLLAGLGAVLRIAVGSTDEVILAHTFRTTPANSGEGGR